MMLLPTVALGRGWDALLPLVSSNEVDAIVFTNLVDALWERQDAAGVARQDIVHSYVSITSTNTETVTNFFGSRSVVSTNYTLVLGTNSVTNVLHQTPHSTIIGNVGTGVVNTIASYIPQWWRGSGNFTNWLSYLVGGSYPQAWMPFEADFSEPANWLMRTGRGMKVFQPTTNSFGRVTTGDGYWTRTYTNEPVDVLLWQGWLAQNSGDQAGATRFTGSLNGNPDNVGNSIYNIGLGSGQTDPDFDFGTNQCAFTYRYGGDAVLTTGITVYATGLVQDILSAEPAGVATGITYSLTNTVTHVADRWLNITDVDPTSGDNPNVGTNNNSILGSDSLTVGYSGILPHYGREPASRLDPLVDYTDVNEMFYVLDAMQVVQQAYNSSGWTYGFNYTNSLYKQVTATNVVWATAKAAATTAWNSASATTNNAISVNNAGQFIALGAEYHARITTSHPTVHLIAPAAYTGQFDYVPRAYFRSENIGTYDAQGTGYIEDLFWTTDADFEAPATNATSLIIGPIPSNTLFSPPNWLAAPITAGFAPTGFQQPADEDLSMTLDFGTPTGGFTHVSDIVYSNLYQ